MDRTPIGHAVKVGGQWFGKVRSNGIVIWESDPLETLELAKAAVERQLVETPGVVMAASKLVEGVADV
jgi:hypothetical protein